MNKPRITALRVDGMDVNLFWVAHTDLAPYGDTKGEAVKAFCDQEGYEYSGQILFGDADYLVVRPTK
ncbi:hypothetical protein TKWG_13290 [Advenella kashmirensis WT001]|uniref:Uncharacterized protein n=1 Tax=Advenella kashmirensis (strain DSM 17095 / LMG 22695 / WT001) TaxID=1036672 RepID=I3UCP4_ADVKW|nr:hypothetical protein TKWG_13290 [Advenella kashmirensis WT001]